MKGQHVLSVGRLLFLVKITGVRALSAEAHDHEVVGGMEVVALSSEGGVTFLLGRIESEGLFEPRRTVKPRDRTGGVYVLRVLGTAGPRQTARRGQLTAFLHRPTTTKEKGVRRLSIKPLIFRGTEEINIRDG